MKEEFRKLNSIHSDVKRWQKIINEEQIHLSDQVNNVSISLNDSNSLLRGIKANPQELAEKLYNKTSEMRDIIYNLENTVLETEGLDFIEDDAITISEQVITNLRSMKDITRLLDNYIKEYLKILSLKENNGHKLDEQLQESREFMMKELSYIKSNENKVAQSLRQLLEKLNHIAVEAEVLARNKIM